jgi:hypothetical protein
MTGRVSKSMTAVGMGCLAAALCVSASAADTANTGTKHKQVHRPETESHKAEGKANTATAKSAHPEAKSVSSSETVHHSAHPATSHKKAHAAGTGSHHGKKTKPVSHRGQQKIDGDRTRQIQEALIREHYLQGEASGKWDDSTEVALRKMQADNGWQNKTVPDSRALIKLGLGPSHDHLLNPDSAMTSAPEAVRTNPISPSNTGSSAASSQPQQ